MIHLFQHRLQQMLALLWSAVLLCKVNLLALIRSATLALLGSAIQLKDRVDPLALIMSACNMSLQWSAQSHPLKTGPP